MAFAAIQGLNQKLEETRAENADLKTRLERLENLLHEMAGDVQRCVTTAVQTPGAPTLSISPATAGQVMISWIPHTPSFVLQETEDLSAEWVDAPSGTENPVTVQTLVPRKFFRLAYRP